VQRQRRVALRQAQGRLLQARVAAGYSGLAEARAPHGAEKIEVVKLGSAAQLFGAPQKGVAG